MIRGYGFFIWIVLLLVLIVSSLAIEAPLPPLIRLHVIANSDTPADQNLKLAVKDVAAKYVQEALQGSEDIADARRKLLDALPGIERQAQEKVAGEGFDYPVRALYGQYDFPVKSYGQFSLPAGRYEALRLVIGQGRGANWWCVLFPPLCFVEGRPQEGFTQEKTAQEIEKLLPQGKLVRVRPAYKVVELWESVAAKVAAK